MNYSESPALAPRALSTDSTPLPPPGLRILCVDDNEEAADSLGMLLGMVGCHVAVSHDAVSALARVEEFQPEVCILDITMPGMDGCELAARLREQPHGEDRLLVALTARGDYNSLQRMADVGFDYHFAKPVAPPELYELLHNFAMKQDFSHK